jgi:hypothetical protein
VRAARVYVGARPPGSKRVLQSFIHIDDPGQSVESRLTTHFADVDTHTRVGRHVQEGRRADEVNARRLQPIYEALDARNYKQCAKLIGNFHRRPSTERQISIFGQTFANPSELARSSYLCLPASLSSYRPITILSESGGVDLAGRVLTLCHGALDSRPRVTVGVLDLYFKFRVGQYVSARLIRHRQSSLQSMV